MNHAEIRASQRAWLREKAEIYGQLTIALVRESIVHRRHDDELLMAQYDALIRERARLAGHFGREVQAHARGWL